MQLVVVRMMMKYEVYHSDFVAQTLYFYTVEHCARCQVKATVTTQSRQGMQSLRYCNYNVHTCNSFEST